MKKAKFWIVTCIVLFAAIFLLANGIYNIGRLFLFFVIGVCIGILVSKIKRWFK